MAFLVPRGCLRDLIGEIEKGKFPFIRKKRAKMLITHYVGEIPSNASHLEKKDAVNSEHDGKYVVIAWCGNCLDHMRIHIPKGVKFTETDQICPKCNCKTLVAVRPAEGF